MLRFKILASTFPLILAGIFAGVDMTSGPRPCIALGQTSLQIAAPWRAQSLVSFTRDPDAATVRVQIVDNPAIADFAVADDADAPDSTGCDTTAATRLIGVTATASSASTPVIYLSREGGADYRIYVQSKTFTVQDAAALVVSAHRAPARLAAASL